MSDEYLWDRTGPPDPEVERLERALERYRWKPPARASSRFARFGLLAASLGAIAALGVFALRGRDATGWELEDSRGGVTIGDCRAEDSKREGLRPGDRVVCAPGASVRLRVGDLGSVNLEEGSVLRVERGGESSGDGAWRAFLERGALTARIFAAPRVFQVGTPAGIAVDLGCVYRTEVDADGRTTLAVVSGRVSFEAEGRRVLVPSGARCAAAPGRGPGTPVWTDAPSEFAEAVDRVDADGDPAALAAVVGTDRAKDSFTLWHLLGHAEARVREAAYDRLSAWVPPPEGLARGAACFSDAEVLDRWKDELSRLW